MVTIPDRSTLRFHNLLTFAVLATVFFFHQGKALMADPMPIPDTTGSFTITNLSSVEAVGSSAVTAPPNPTFSLATVGYFLVSGTTSGVSGAVRSSSSEPAAGPELGAGPASGSGGNWNFSGGSQGGAGGTSPTVGSASTASIFLPNLDTDSLSTQSLDVAPLAAPTTVPEPGSFWLLIAGLAIIGARRYVVQRG